MSTKDLEELEKLYELKSKGIITEAEYEFKKNQLLHKNNSLNNMQIENKTDGTYWLPIPSFILGFISFLASFDLIKTEDELVGLIFMIILSFILGTITLSIQRNGRGLAITGIILSIFSSLILLAYYNQLNKLNSILGG